jgi:Ca2+-binding EF-hand superfamily protein
MIIDLDALARYDAGTMTRKILTRVINGCGKPPSKGAKSGLMTYEDFVWFILSTEDKRSNQSIEYWFRCMDLDGDGVISLFEMEEFYKEQYKRMHMSRVSDVWKLEDFVCSLYAF